MTELWLIRHGQTDWNLGDRYQGQSDIPLNATGLAQAYALAGQLVGKGFTALYSSDLQREWRTAEILAEGIRNPTLLDAAAPGGESTLQVASRMPTAANAIAASYPRGPVLVVSHGFALATLVCQAEGISLAEIYRFISDNAKPTVIDWAIDGKTTRSSQG